VLRPVIKVASEAKEVKEADAAVAGVVEGDEEDGNQESLGKTTEIWLRCDEHIVCIAWAGETIRHEAKSMASGVARPSWRL
jgi:hypothetical protein